VLARSRTRNLFESPDSRTHLVLSSLVFEGNHGRTHRRFTELVGALDPIALLLIHEDLKLVTKKRTPRQGPPCPMFRGLCSTRPTRTSRAGSLAASKDGLRVWTLLIAPRRGKASAENSPSLAGTSHHAASLLHRFVPVIPNEVGRYRCERQNQVESRSRR